MNYINGAEISFYSIDGNNFTIDLSPTQVMTICKILGLNFKASGTVEYFSDETLKQFEKMPSNPLRLKP